MGQKKRIAAEKQKVRTMTMKRKKKEKTIGPRSEIKAGRNMGVTHTVKVASWNVRSLRSDAKLKMMDGEFDYKKNYNMDKLGSIIRIMKDKNIWAATLQDTRISSRMCPMEGGWTLISCGKQKKTDGRQAYGVAILLSPAATKLWKADGKWEACPEDKDGQTLSITFPIHPGKGDKGRRLALMVGY